MRFNFPVKVKRVSPDVSVWAGVDPKGMSKGVAAGVEVKFW